MFSMICLVFPAVPFMFLLWRDAQKSKRALAATHAMCYASERFCELAFSDPDNPRLPGLAADYAFLYLQWLELHPYCQGDHHARHLYWLVGEFMSGSPDCSELLEGIEKLFPSADA